MLSLRVLRGTRAGGLACWALVAAASAGTGLLLLAALGWALGHQDRGAAAAVRLVWCVVPVAVTVQLAVVVGRALPARWPRSGLTAVGLGRLGVVLVTAVSSALVCAVGSAVAALVFLLLRGDLWGDPYDGSAAALLGGARALPPAGALTLLAVVPVTAAAAMATTLRVRPLPAPPAPAPATPDGPSWATVFAAQPQAQPESESESGSPSDAAAARPADRSSWAALFTSRPAARAAQTVRTAGAVAGSGAEAPAGAEPVLSGTAGDGAADDADVDVEAADRTADRDQDRDQDEAPAGPPVGTDRPAHTSAETPAPTTAPSPDALVPARVEPQVARVPAAAAPPGGLPWGVAFTAVGLAVEVTAPHGHALALPGGLGRAGLTLAAGWVLATVGMVLAGPGVVHACGRLLALYRPGALRLLAGRALQEEARRVGRPLGLLCATAAAALGAYDLHRGGHRPLGPVTVFAAVLIAVCVLAITAGSLLDARQARAQATTTLRDLGATPALLRGAVALRAGVVLAVAVPLTALVAGLATVPTPR